MQVKRCFFDEMQKIKAKKQYLYLFLKNSKKYLRINITLYIFAIRITNS